MKRIIPYLLGLAMVGLSASATSAGEGRAEGSATAEVHALVTPNISVTPIQPIVDAGSIQIGDLRATIYFQVHANTEAVKFWVCATDLWKGTRADGATVPPIPLNSSAGAIIDPIGATVLGGGSNVAAFVRDSNIMGLPAKETEQIAFESKDNGTFSHDVCVTVSWTLSNNEQPQGDYGGKVQLCAMVMPDGQRP